MVKLLQEYVLICKNVILMLSIVCQLYLLDYDAVIACAVEYQLLKNGPDLQ